MDLVDTKACFRKRMHVEREKRKNKCRVEKVLYSTEKILSTPKRDKKILDPCRVANLVIKSL